jgi:UDP-N-acetylmuramate dehydrogenase
MNMSVRVRAEISRKAIVVTIESSEMHDDARRRAAARLQQIPCLAVSLDVPLSRYTRFGIGGPADIIAETPDEHAFIEAVRAARASGLPTVVIGGGTNLIVSDAGFRGIVLRFTAAAIASNESRVHADAGAILQDLVDYTAARGLKGLETLAGIPGSVGAAVYGNAGAYGHSISERVRSVRFFDGETVREFDNRQCEFHYRESVFKRHKNWVIFSTELEMEHADARALCKAADDIVRIRNEKFPPTMKCAGSIFKNLLLVDIPARLRPDVPESVIREGKVPAAFFLEQAGAKGLSHGDIHVATYHANLVYNGGAGTAEQLTYVIDELKRRVHEKFGFDLEEEVQYVGF